MASEPYTPENVQLFETFYGKNLISLGGLSAVDNMFSDINLDGRKALDIGFGLGGVAYYLAQTRAMKIYGVEIHQWMVKHALSHIPSGLEHLLHFDVYTPSGEIPFNQEKFDIAYSKGVLNHVREKDSLFQKIYSRLKPGGLFVIADWIYPDKAVNKQGPLVQETEESYLEVLSRNKFTEIEFRDDSKIFQSYVKLFLDNLNARSDAIKNNYGEDEFNLTLQQHLTLLDALINKHRFATRIVAKK